MEVETRAVWLDALHAELHTVQLRWDDFMEASDQWLRTHRSIQAAGPTGGLLQFLGPHFESRASMWMAISGLLSAWARASLILFPTRGSRERGRVLRELIGVSDDDEFRHRALRDDWVHFDERLDDALAERADGPAWSFVANLDPSSNAELQIVVELGELHFRHGRSTNTSLESLVTSAVGVKEKVLKASADIRTWMSDPNRALEAEADPPG